MDIIIETERLLIRKITHKDIDGMYELDSDPEVQRYLGGQPVKTKEESKMQIDAIIQQYHENGIARWAMTEKNSGEFMGWTGLKFTRELTNGHIHYYDLGYRLIKRFWGKGYASESARASLDYGFRYLNTDTIYAMADSRNQTSLHILEKTGLKRSGQFHYQNTLHEWLRITRGEWNDLRT